MIYERKNVSRSSIMLIPSILALALIWPKDIHASVYEYTLMSGDYKLVDAKNGYQELKMEGFGCLLDPGKPKLPSRIFFIAIPPDAKLKSVKTQGNRLTKLSGKYKISPSPMVISFDATEKEIEMIKTHYNKTIRECYSSDKPYPKNPGQFIGEGGYREYNLVQIRFSPFVYEPKSGSLWIYKSLNVEISYSSDIGRKSEKEILHFLPEAEQIAQGFIVNYEDASKWYLEYKSPWNMPPGFVIITSNALKQAVWPIDKWERWKGRDVYIVTVENIKSQYKGIDIQETIRNFLCKHLYEWRILDVLLVGDIVDIPMRYLHFGYPTDHYYAELSLPDRYSWDANGDNIYYGSGDYIQYPYEVNVGRIPFSDPKTVQKICYRMAAFECDYDKDYKLHCLFAAAFFDCDTDTATTKELIKTNELDPNRPPVRIYEYDEIRPDQFCWTTTYSYEYSMSPTITREVWSNQHGDGYFGFVNLSGHGSAGAVWYRERHPVCWQHKWFFVRTDCEYLDNRHPAIVFAEACLTSMPEQHNLGKALLEQGAVTYLGLARKGDYCMGWDEIDDGCSQTFDYLFSRYVASHVHRRYSVGDAHRKSVTEMITSYNYYNTSAHFLWNLYGNPDLRLLDIRRKHPPFIKSCPSMRTTYAISRFLKNPWSVGNTSKVSLILMNFLLVYP